MPARRVPPSWRQRLAADRCIVARPDAADHHRPVPDAPLRADHQGRMLACPVGPVLWCGSAVSQRWQLRWQATRLQPWEIGGVRIIAPPTCPHRSSTTPVPSYSAIVRTENPARLDDA